jgi:hypothetical protein
MGEIPSRVRIPLSPPVNAPVAQLDRVFGYEPKGRRFESFRARHFKLNKKIKFEDKSTLGTIQLPGRFEPRGSTKYEAKSAQRGAVFWTRFSAPQRGEEGAKRRPNLSLLSGGTFWIFWGILKSGISLIYKTNGSVGRGAHSRQAKEINIELTY